MWMSKERFDKGIRVRLGWYLDFITILEGKWLLLHCKDIGIEA
jgi:hypothetical protein